MFDLGQEMAKWRQEMTAPGLNSEIIRELEEHLREEIDQQVRGGKSLPEAFKAALHDLGKPTALRNEFALDSQPVRAAEVLRRSEGKILGCSALALLAAIGLHVLRPTWYQSEAKLLIRYVATEVYGDQSLTEESRRRAPTTAVVSEEHERLMNAQVEILNSFDLAREVAATIGPKKILLNAGGGEDLTRAAALIRTGLYVQVGAKSSVIRITASYPDSNLPQPVLREVIDQFLKLHVEKYRMNRPSVSIGRITNISQIQSPSPPFHFVTLFGTLGMFVGGCALIMIGWVVIVRFFADQGERRLRETA